MNHDEAKQTLLLYRPDQAETTDPQMAEALALANGDAELSSWFTEHCARQKTLREKFRQITPPAGLLEQIISEQAASQRMLLYRRRFTRIAVASAAAVMLILVGLFWFNQGSPADTDTDNTLAFYKQQMAGTALRGYGMDLRTNDAEQIRTYFKGQHSPADYALSGALQQAGLMGCSIQSWQSAKVSMICFRTGQPLAPGFQNDLWLFVVDQKSVPDAPQDSTPQIASVNRLATATWVKDGKLYLLGTTAGESVLRKFL
jgi:hypothetical protein